MGAAIIALTILIRLILLPPTIRSLIAQRKLKDLQAEFQKIQKDHGHDKEMMLKKTTELYQKHGVTPLSSCLPVLIQFPVLIALYQVFFRLSVQGQFNDLYPFIAKPGTINTHFLWLNLSAPDPFYILPILAAGFQLVLSKMTAPKDSKASSKKETDSTQEFQKTLSKQMLYLFPVMTFLIAIKLPSALALYWVVATFFGIIQQYIVEKGKLGLRNVGAGKKTIIMIKRKDGESK